MNVQNFILLKIILEKLHISLTYTLYHEEFVFFNEKFKSITPGNLCSLVTACMLVFGAIHIFRKKLFTQEFMEISGVLSSIYFSESITKNNWIVRMEPQSHFFFISILVYVLLMCQVISAWQNVIGKLAIPLPQFLQLYVASTVIQKFDDHQLTLCLWILSVTFVLVPIPNSPDSASLHSRIFSLCSAISARMIVREFNLFLVQYQDCDSLRLELVLAQLFFIFFDISSLSEKTVFLKEILMLSCAQNIQTLILFKATSSVSFTCLTFLSLFVICQCDCFQNFTILNILKYSISFTVSLQISKIVDLLTSGYEKNAILFVVIVLLKSCAIHIENYLKKKKYSLDKFQDKFILINIVDWEDESEDSKYILNSNLGLPGLS